MRIAGNIGVAVMKPVIAGPLYGRAGGQPERNGQPLKPLRQQQRLVRQRAVVTQIDAEAGDQVIRETIEAKYEHEKTSLTDHQMYCDDWMR